MNSVRRKTNAATKTGGSGTGIWRFDFTQEVKEELGVDYVVLEFQDNPTNLVGISVEFLFPEAVLQKKTGGHGLEFKQKVRTYRIGKLEEKEEETTEPQYRTIVGGKTLFANRVVPNLEDDSFEKFRTLFDLILNVFDFLKKSND